MDTLFSTIENYHEMTVEQLTVRSSSFLGLGLRRISSSSLYNELRTSFDRKFCQDHYILLPSFHFLSVILSLV